MRRGTTPRIAFSIISDDTHSYLDVYLTIKQDLGNRVVEVTKRADATESGYEVRFTQEDTLKFEPNKDAYIQAKVKTSEGLVDATDIVKERITDVLYEEVI